MNPIHSHQHHQQQQQLQQQQQQHRLSLGTTISSNSFNSFHGLSSMGLNMNMGGVSVPTAVQHQHQHQHHALQNHVNVHAAAATQNATFHNAAAAAAAAAVSATGTPFQIPVISQHQHQHQHGHQHGHQHQHHRLSIGSIGSTGPPGVAVSQIIQPQQTLSLQQQAQAQAQAQQQQLPNSAGGSLGISPQHQHQQQRTVAVAGWNPLQYHQHQTSNDATTIAPVPAAGTSSPAPGSVAFNAQVQAQAQAQAQVNNQILMAAGAAPFASSPATATTTTTTNTNTNTGTNSSAPGSSGGNSSNSNNSSANGGNSNSTSHSANNGNNSVNNTTGSMITTVQQLQQAAAAAGGVGGLVHHQQQQAQAQAQPQQISLSNPAVIQSLPQSHGHNHTQAHQLTEQQQQLIQQKKLIDQLELQIAQHQRTMAEMNCGAKLSANLSATVSSVNNVNVAAATNTDSIVGKDGVVGAQQQQQQRQQTMFGNSATDILQQQQQQQQQQQGIGKINVNVNPMSISSMENVAAAMRRSSDLSLGAASVTTGNSNGSGNGNNNHNASSSPPAVPLVTPSGVTGSGSGSVASENTTKNMFLQQLQQHQQQQQQQQQTSWQTPQQGNVSSSPFLPVSGGSTGVPNKGEDDTSSSSYGGANVNANANMNSNAQRSGSANAAVGGVGGSGSGSSSNGGSNNGTNGGSNTSGDSSKDDKSKNYSTLRGSFAGGWQSNNDLPDRRLIIIGIAKLIDKMQPNGNDHRKLPIVAKKLEECLYRMAKTKEEYMNASTLKRRLQVIAMSLAPKKRDSEHEKAKPLQAVSVEAQQRIDLLRNRQLESRINVPNRPHHVSSSVGRNQSSSGTRNSGQSSGQQVNADTNVAAIHNAALTEMLKQQHLKAYHAAIAELQPNFAQAAQKQSTSSTEMSSKSRTNNSNTNIDSNSIKGQSQSNLSSKQKNKVIRQQQQRLILLRHASKCKVGPSCEIKFCAQMVKLWNHMKECRNKDCTTPHCLSSRCVLNHYKTCKDEGRTATCEVCQPVVQWIRGSQDEKCIKIDDQVPNQSLSSATTVPTNQCPSSVEAAMSSWTAEFQTKRLQLEQQYKILKQFEHQQALQQRNHEENNIDPRSEMGQKLIEQKILLERCKKQFNNKQRALEEAVKSRSKRLKTENGRIDICPPTNNLTATARNSFGQSSQDNPLSVGKTTIENLSSTQYAGIFDSKKPGDDDATTKENESTANGFWGDFTPNEVKPSNKRRRSEISFAADDFDELEHLFKVDSEASFLDSLDDPNEVLDVLKTDFINIGEADDSGVNSVTSQLLPIVQKILDHQYGWLFKDPVDPVELGIPDYFDVIKEPMDLGKVKERLESEYYTTIESAAQDVKLVFENAIKYNGESSEVGCMAVQLMEIFDSELNSVKSSPANNALLL